MAGPHPRASKDGKPSTTTKHAPLSPESLSLAQLRTKTISHPMQRVQITIYIPPHTVGAIIGKGGRTILGVQREAMRRSAGHVNPIRISAVTEATESSSSNQNNNEDAENNPNQQGGEDETDYDKDDPMDYWTPVVVKGDPVGCFSAVRQIVTLVEGDNDPDIVLDVPIHKTKHNSIVGKGGLIIAALSATYETRIMVPPNELMENVHENVWTKKRQDAGAALLFGNNNDSDEKNNSSTNSTTTPNPNEKILPGMTPPPNIIQLEGDIDKVEHCLVKMLSIVAGEKWIPTGVIDHRVHIHNAKLPVQTAAKTAPAAAVATATSPTVTSGNTNMNNKDETYAEAVIIKVWTPDSKLLNLGKIRKVQRKTNTVIRRKKIRLREDKNVPGVTIVNEENAAVTNNESQEEDVVDKDVNEEDENVDEDENEEENEDDVDDNDEEGEEGGDDTKEDEVLSPTAGKSAKSSHGNKPKTATKYIITGTTKSVKSATAQFEKILGLEPGSATIVDTTAKVRAKMEKESSSGGGNEKDTKHHARAGSKAEGGEVKKKKGKVPRYLSKKAAYARKKTEKAQEKVEE